MTIRSHRCPHFAPKAPGVGRSEGFCLSIVHAGQAVVVTNNFARLLAVSARRGSRLPALVGEVVGVAARFRRWYHAACRADHLIADPNFLRARRQR